jgi:hypothetical protein
LAVTPAQRSASAHPQPRAPTNAAGMLPLRDTRPSPHATVWSSTAAHAAAADTARPVAEARPASLREYALTAAGSPVAASLPPRSPRRAAAETPPSTRHAAGVEKTAAARRSPHGAGLLARHVQEYANENEQPLTPVSGGGGEDQAALPASPHAVPALYSTLLLARKIQQVRIRTTACADDFVVCNTFLLVRVLGSCVLAATTPYCWPAR